MSKTSTEYTQQSLFNYNRYDIMEALKRIGYSRYGDPQSTSLTKSMTPEQLIACLVYSRDQRWITAIGVVICNVKIKWETMSRLAIDYGFAGTLRGIVKEICDAGRHVDDKAFELLNNYKPIKRERIRKVLDTYGC